jgi:hypothetical protein
LTEDRPLYRDIAKVAELIVNGEIVEAVHRAIGRLT